MKFFSSHIGLKLKLILLVVVLILVIMSSIAFLFGVRHERTLRGEMRKRATNIAQITGSMSLLQIPGASPMSLSKSFVSLIPQLDSNVLYVVIFDETGKAAATAVNRPLLKILSKEEEIDAAERELI